MNDSQLFFKLARLTQATLALWQEVEAGDWNESIPDDLSRDALIRDLDVPCLDKVLLDAIEEVNNSLDEAARIAKADGAEKLCDRIRRIRESGK